MHLDYFPGAEKHSNVPDNMAAATSAREAPPVPESFISA